MGAVEFRIAPEASPFRGDAYFEGLGAQKNHVWKSRLFLKRVFKHIVWFFCFWGHIFHEKYCLKKTGLGATLVLGVGPGKLLQ